MMIFKICAALVALRSVAFVFVMGKSYAKTPRRFVDLFSHILIGAADVLIVSVCVRYILDGVL